MTNGVIDVVPMYLTPKVGVWNVICSRNSHKNILGALPTIVVNWYASLDESQKRGAATGSQSVECNPAKENCL
jgi:hypothetical protein